MAEERLAFENLHELRASFRDVGGKEMQKELGKVHKRVGTIIIARAGGPKTGVGEGAGSTMRPSAASREVMIRVGGKHRGEPPQEQWGKSQVWPPPERPNIIGAAVQALPLIEKEYRDGVEDVARRAGFFK